VIDIMPDGAEAAKVNTDAFFTYTFQHGQQCIIMEPSFLEGSPIMC